MAEADGSLPLSRKASVASSDFTPTRVRAPVLVHMSIGGEEAESVGYTQVALASSIAVLYQPKLEHWTSHSLDCSALSAVARASHA